MSRETERSSEIGDLPSSSHRPVGEARSRRALVVDDHDDARRLFALMLESDGWACDAASDGQEGVVRALAVAYDLILMDLRLPVLSGLDAIRQLRSQGLTVRIIAVTADTFRCVREQALEAGADAYLTKPVPRATLLTQCIHPAIHPGGSASLT